jgi:hypothetical protein
VGSGCWHRDRLGSYSLIHRNAHQALPIARPLMTGCICEAQTMPCKSGYLCCVISDVAEKSHPRCDRQSSSAAIFETLRPMCLPHWHSCTFVNVR